MQTDYNLIYKELAEKTGLSEQIYKDIGTFIFAETSQLMHEPPSLIIRLRGIGRWFLRKKRMEIVVTQWSSRGEEREREELQSDYSWDKYVSRKKQYDIFVERLKDYEKYISQRDEVRRKRNEQNKVLPRPDKGEDIRFKSS